MDLTMAKSRQHQKREAFSYKENAILLQALRKHGLRLVHKSSPRSEVTNQLWEVLLQRINAVSRYGRTRAQCRNRICKMIQLARKKAKEIITAHNTTLGGGLPFPKLTDTEEFLVHLSEYDFLRNFPGNNFDISAKADMDSQVSKDSEQSPINLDQSKDPESISMDVECHQNKEVLGIPSNQDYCRPLYQYINYNNPELNQLSPEEQENEDNSLQATVWNQPLAYIVEKDFVQQTEERTVYPGEVLEEITVESELVRRTEENINKMLCL